MKDLLQSSKVKTALWIVGGVLVLLIVFGVGAAVGYHRALFTARFGENYYRNFYGAPAPGGPTGPMSFSTHGVAGEVIDVATSSLAVKDSAGNEQSVEVIPATVIREGNDTITLADVVIGGTVTVIGGPNEAGQIEARFIRVFPASSSMPFGQ
jgi:phage baseplate assembly protein gpV